MSKYARRYPPEFREEAVKLAQRSGKSIQQIANDLGVSHQSLRRWIAQAENDAGQREGLTTEEREELRRLRRENRILRQEREILKKPRPSSPRRLIEPGNDLLIREAQTGRVCGVHHVSGAGGLHQRILCVAPARPVN